LASEVGVRSEAVTLGPLWSPIKESGSLTSRIAERIVTLIDEYRLAPGERLPSEREMARMLGVSRPALREAVKGLEAHGRLAVRHGQGVFVGEGPPDRRRAGLAGLEVSLSELYAMREVLEAPAAEWAAAQADAEDVRALAAALAAEEEARCEPVDFGRLGRLDAQFHLKIVELAGNRYLLRTVGELQEMLAAGMDTTLTIPGRIAKARRDHRAIYQAIRRRDPVKARAAAVAHIHGARDAALARVREEAGGHPDDPEESAPIAPSRGRTNQSGRPPR
jgi:GntR family transcriptional repressor for pyruvate dehydrogenase complex